LRLLLNRQEGGCPEFKNKKGPPPWPPLLGTAACVWALPFTVSILGGAFMTQRVGECNSHLHCRAQDV
jgi:hypothetical protein